MNPLALDQRVFTWFGVYPFNVTPQRWSILFSISFDFAVFTMALAFISASAVFFLKYMSNNLEQSLYALLQIAASFIMAIATIVIVFSRRKLANVFASLEIIYQKYGNKDISQYLESANEKSQRNWKFFLKYVMGGFLVNNVSLSALSVVICYMKIGHFDAKCAYLPYKKILPWNQQTPIGFFFDLTFDIVGAEGYWIAFGSLLLLFISINLHHRAFFKMFRHMLKTLDNADQNRNNTNFIREVVQLHRITKEWFFETSDFYSPYIAAQLLCSMVILACVVFQIDLELKHLDYNISVLLMAGANGASSLYLYCFYGKIATESFSDMGNCMFESNWQSLPVNLQKYFILMIGNAQPPLCYNGYGIVTLNLGTFTTTLKTVMTYYMMMKTITSN